MFFHFTANQMRRQSTTEEILIARGFRRESTTEDIMRCRNVRSGQVSKLWETNSWKVLTLKKINLLNCAFHMNELELYSDFRSSKYIWLD